MSPQAPESAKEVSTISVAVNHELRDIRAVGHRPASGDLDVALISRAQAGDHAEQNRLAGAVGSDDRRDRLVPGLQADVMDTGAVGEDPTQVADVKGDAGCHHRSPSLSVVPLPRPRAR